MRAFGVLLDRFYCSPRLPFCLFVHIPDGDGPQAWVFVCLDNNDQTGGVSTDEQGAPSRV